MLLYCKSCALLFAAKRGLLVHIKFVLLLPSSMAGSLIMASALQQLSYVRFIKEFDVGGTIHQFCIHGLLESVFGANGL